LTKRERIGNQILIRGSSGDFPAAYQLFFSHFNSGEYYEAHDVLEHLWLECNDSNLLFYQGLIQIAGGFVHLRRQFLRPNHPKDGRKLNPACRLLDLGVFKIREFGPRHMGLDVKGLCVFCETLARDIENSGFQTNPWNPEALPQIRLSLPQPDSGGARQE
jgi:hypothetical protein